MFQWRQRTALTLAALGFTTAGDAFMQMGFHQQSAGGRELADAILRQQRTYVFTTADGLYLSRCEGSFLVYALPDALPGGVHGLMIRLLGAHGRERMVKQFA